MDRRHFVATLLALGFVPRAAKAQTAESQVIAQLQRQGYTRISMRRTLLGRTRIVAFGPNGRREIILNPATGAILRDYVDRDRDAWNSGRNDNDNGSRHSGGDDRDDDRDDDSDDDDDDDDSDDDDDDDDSDDDNDDDDSDDDD